ncbi:unnamed protein product [Adineta steineri]|uniref:F-box domain-containing protein n=1 Tax=Adineta steineri TaxID=433720 RepID=A0A815RP68_9BILA|nr:unnamed protein product [Adineta steineri]
MNKKKRQQDTTLDKGVDDGKIKKLRGTLLITNNPDIRIFEDICNELLKEVFEYFDGYEIYYSFFNLNKRFQSLLTSSTLRIKIHTSFISKPIFQKYYTHFIEPYKHRIKSLHLSNPCIMHLFSNISQYSQLENLLLDNTESQYLENILLHITSLSNLSSLVIHINDNSNQIQIYNQIFLLSTLKYCKISFDKNIQLEQLPISTNISSSIEHLVIIGKCYLTELHNFLSYLPHLCRLSVKYINAVYNQIIENYSFISNKLTFVSLKLDTVKFVNFEEFVKNHFNQVKQCYISTTRDMTYLEANKWEQLIISYMPCLQIFNLQHTIKNFCDYPEDIFETLFNDFNSQFWQERQWLFRYEPNSGEYQQGIFHSIQPYRKKNFLIANNPEKIRSDVETLHSVRHVIIQDHQSITNCSKYFPNIDKLTLADRCSLHCKWFVTDKFHQMIPLKQLTQLNIDIHDIYFHELVHILFYTPNIHTLRLKSIKLFTKEVSSLEKDEISQLKFNENKITNITITDDYSLRAIKILMKFCSTLQHITIGIFRDSLLPTVRFLLSENIETLSSLCIIGVNTMWSEKLKSLIESDKDRNDYSIKTISDKFYLWW